MEIEGVRECSPPEGIKKMKCRERCKVSVPTPSHPDCGTAERQSGRLAVRSLRG